MRLRTPIALAGSLVSVAGVVALYATLGVGWISLAIVSGVVVAAYVLAAIGATGVSSGLEEALRGGMLGWNAALNAVLGFTVLSLMLPTALAAVIAGAIGLLVFVAVFEPVSQSEVYQGFLGWLNWLMPMSWLVVGLGFLFYVICFLGHAVTAGRVPYLRVESLGADWKTGTFFIKGGLISNLNYLDTAFNMGNFSFVDAKSGGWHKDHEAGHTLNLAAFGSVFHLVGALDENATPRGANAYSERIAESNDTGASGSNIPMWS